MAVGVERATDQQLAVAVPQGDLVGSQIPEGAEVFTQTSITLERIGLKGSPTWVSKIFSPERAKGEIL